MAAILTNGVLKHGAHLSAAVGAGALQGLWEHKGSRCTPANAAHSPPRRSPAPARARHAARKLTLSQLINRLLPQRTPVRHRRSNRRRLVRPNNQITRALAPPSLPRPPSPTPHDLTPHSSGTRCPGDRGNNPSCGFIPPLVAPPCSCACTPPGLAWVGYAGYTAGYS